MSAPDPKTERLTEFERAVCYDTLPQYTRPISLGIVLVYAALLIGAFLVLAYGIRQDVASWRFWGSLLLAVVICVGILGFVYRALYYAIRQRNALLRAKQMPNVESSFDELPDPFATHALLRYCRVDESKQKSITGNKGEVVYTATRAGDHAWDVHDPAGELAFTVRASRPPRSFSFDWGVPSQFQVKRGDELLAEIDRPLTLGAGRVEIHSKTEPKTDIVFRDGGLYESGTLIGRIYALRNHLYLDIRQSNLDHAILGFYIGMLN